MARGSFRVLHATDGSPSARAALNTSIAFPWPEPSEARVVFARPGAFRPEHLDGWGRSLEEVRTAVAAAGRRLARRWTRAESVVLDGPAHEQIREEAQRWRADAIVVGWRGHSGFRRLLMGSVSRQVLRESTVPVLVVRRARASVQRLVVGYDGSAPSERAVELLAKCRAPKGGAVWLVTVLSIPPAPNHPLLGRISIQARAELTKLATRERRKATNRQRAAVRALQAAGWRVHQDVRTGAVLYELLRAAAAARADVAVVGGSSRGTVRTRVFGSTAEGAVNRSPVPVLVVP